ncbi:MAG: hypothetical protein CME65_08770 [Halobacteriovoraceae bacterium]|nr:hypothetical protein [Halobacteriovoraceae bacterium]
MKFLDIKQTTKDLLRVTLLGCLISCSRFPYQGVVEESEKYLKISHSEAFKKISMGEDSFQYVSLGNEKGPLVVLVHGSPGGWGAFAHLYKDPELLDKVQLVTFDRLGYGENNPGTPALKLEDQATIAKSLIRKYLTKDRKLIVLGHSYGGPVATKIVSQFRDKTHRLILVAASMSPKLEEELWYQSLGKQRLIRWMIPSFLDVCNREIIALKVELKKLEKQYPMTVPTTIIHGKKDQLVPFGNVDYIKKHFTSSKLIVNDHMGHFVPWAFPQLLINEIKEASD